jgi:hypothetical protein
MWNVHFTVPVEPIHRRLDPLDGDVLALGRALRADDDLAGPDLDDPVRPTSEGGDGRPYETPKVEEDKAARAVVIGLLAEMERKWFRVRAQPAPRPSRNPGCPGERAPQRSCRFPSLFTLVESCWLNGC